MKQNVNYNNRHTFNMQFDFCPKCQYFRNCYNLDRNGYDHYPSYISEECFDVFHQVLIEIKDFINFENNRSLIYPWVKQIEKIMEDDFDKMEELYMEAGGDDTNLLYQSINVVLGVNPVLQK